MSLQAQMALQPPRSINMDLMTREDFLAKLETGHQEALAGKTVPAEVVIAEMREKYNLK